MKRTDAPDALAYSVSVLALDVSMSAAGHLALAKAEGPNMLSSNIGAETTTDPMNTHLAIQTSELFLPVTLSAALAKRYMFLA